MKPWSKYTPTFVSSIPHKSCVVFHSFLILHFAIKFINVNNDFCGTPCIVSSPFFSSSKCLIIYGNFRNSAFPPPWYLWCFCHWKKKKAFMEGLSSFPFIASSSPVSVPSFVPSIPLYIVLSYLKPFSFEILANHANSKLESFLFHHTHNHILTPIFC